MRFKQILVKTAFDGVEENRGLKLDRKGTGSPDSVYAHTIQRYPIVLRYLKMPYKGTPTQNIIRKPLEDKEVWLYYTNNIVLVKIVTLNIYRKLKDKIRG